MPLLHILLRKVLSHMYTPRRQARAAAPLPPAILATTPAAVMAVSCQSLMSHGIRRRSASVLLFVCVCVCVVCVCVLCMCVCVSLSLSLSLSLVSIAISHVIAGLSWVPTDRHTSRCLAATSLSLYPPNQRKPSDTPSPSAPGRRSCLDPQQHHRQSCLQL